MSETETETEVENEERTCIDGDCEGPRERVVTLYGGVAAVCEEHAEERLEHPDAIDNTAYFKGEREEPISDPVNSPHRAGGGGA